MEKAKDDCRLGFLKRIRFVEGYGKDLCVDFFINCEQALLISINIPRDAVGHKGRINCSM